MNKLRKGSGMAIGIAIGLSTGVAIRNIGVGVALGVAMGAAFEAGNKKQRATLVEFKKITAEELKDSLRSKGIKGLAIDIDDVLCYTDNHWVDEMSKFANPENLTREEILKKYKNFDNVPYWNTPEAMAVVDKLMHSNEFQETVPLIENADQAIHAINKIVPVVAYITARPLSVYEGTRSWLTKHGFLSAPIVFRDLDTKHEHRNMWKAELLKDLYPEVLGIIDDHPELGEQLRSLGYEGRHYLYDNGSNEKDYKEGSALKTWEEIVENIARDYKEGE